MSTTTRAKKKAVAKPLRRAQSTRKPFAKPCTGSVLSKHACESAVPGQQPGTEYQVTVAWTITHTIAANSASDAEVLARYEPKYMPTTQEGGVDTRVLSWSSCKRQRRTDDSVSDSDDDDFFIAQRRD